MLLGGCFLGLVYVQIGDPPAQADVTEAPTPTRYPDAWAQSRASAEILRRQEGAPSPLVGEKRLSVSPAAVRIVDGDTFHYGSETIRIADIDTPEVMARCPYEAELAARATRRLDVLLAAGPFKLAPTGRDEDRYGRKLRVVTRDGRSLGDVLVAEGLAREWTGRREPWCT